MSDTCSVIPSPCVGLCRMDEANRWCEGCLRSRDEIAGWGTMADLEKLTLRTQLTQRRQTLRAPTPPRAPAPDT